jgi:GT2 family glycosyltransferase
MRHLLHHKRPPVADSALSVVIVTWRRPDHVRSCLEHLARQEPVAEEVLVIDASRDRRTAAVVADFPGARRIAFRRGARNMTAARNAGLREARGEIIAFIDDDANVQPGWVAALRDAFVDRSVDALAGRVCLGTPGEEAIGLRQIGRLLAGGVVTGNFAADPGRAVEVDCAMGACMAFRRATLARLGGFRDDFPGTQAREETDIFMRLAALGGRVIFDPAVAVDHVWAAPVRGRRGDSRFWFWTRANTGLLVARNRGIGSRDFRTWLSFSLRHAEPGSEIYLGRLARASSGLAGLATGVALALSKARWGASDPVRRDGVGRELARVLAADPARED